MSLIQVSSTQRLGANMSGGQGAFNTGYRFTNYFAANINIPENCEIALHNASFAIDKEAAVDLYNLGFSTGLGDFPCFRLLLGNEIGDYSDDQDLESGTCPVHFPLAHYPDRKRYFNIASLWEQLVSCINTSPIPSRAFHIGQAAPAIAASGIAYTYTSPAGVPTITLAQTINLHEVSPGELEGIGEPAVSNWANIGNYGATAELVNLFTPAGWLYETARSVRKNTGTSNSANPACWTTNSNGVHTSGGHIFCTSMNSASVRDDGTLANPTRHIFTLGCRRWAALNTEADMVIKSALQYPYEEVGVDIEAYLFSRELINKYRLRAEQIGEYFWYVTPKTKTITGDLRVTAFKQSMVIHICKLEMGVPAGDTEFASYPRVLCIATGDTDVSTKYGIPYSGQLNPLAVAAPGISGYPGDPGFVLQRNLAPGGMRSPQLHIRFTGNACNFQVAGVNVAVTTSPAEWNNLAMETQQYSFSDMVYPLQVCGSMCGHEDSMERLQYSCCFLGGQAPVDYLGNTASDYFKYVTAQQMIPASIYNTAFFRSSPRCFYPLEAGTTDPESNEPVMDELVPAVAFPTDPPNDSYTLDLKQYCCLGRDPATDPFDWPDYGIQFPQMPNLQGACGFATTATTAAGFNSLNFDDGGGDYVELGVNYALDGGVLDPFLLGLYVRLKNLQNRAVMGSINQTSDKLISVVNNYTQKIQQGLDYPIYSWDAYEHLYINLNNPSAIPLSQLDFEIVDKFGNPITCLKETTLVLHLRPADYKWTF